MKSKLTVALLFGGRSPEHEVSIRSARNILAAMDAEKYEVILIGVGYSGAWYEVSADFLNDPKNKVVAETGTQLALLPGVEGPAMVRLSNQEALPKIDVVFPIIHGPNGEDGSLQGILRQLNLPFVGPDVTSSSAAMDKDFTKRLLREADLLTAEYVCVQDHEKDAIDFFAVANKLGTPVYIKPANMGSSVGVKRATNREEFQAAIQEAFRFDTKIIIEEEIVGREVECAVMGNGQIAATSVGEVVMDSGFYDYDSKYEDPDAAKIMIPAENIDNQLLAKLILVAKSAYQTLGCEGFTRVDMFLREDDSVYVNELNTLPGFTSISMYPKLWEHAGTTYSELIDQLIELALERAKRKSRLEIVRS